MEIQLNTLNKCFKSTGCSIHKFGKRDRRQTPNKVRSQSTMSSPFCFTHKKNGQELRMVNFGGGRGAGIEIAVIFQAMTED
jgi:hypothetical protein